MGQNQSTFHSDNPEVRKIHEIAKKHGPSAVQDYLDEQLNKWKEEPVKLGIIGRTATGKSTFINAIRGVQEGDDGFAEVGRGNTTRKPTSYLHPDNDRIEFVDLPGFGTLTFPKNEYIDRMKIRDFDYLIVFFDTVMHEDDKWAMFQLLTLGKPFSLVRSKVDKDVKAGVKRGENEESVITSLRAKIMADLITCRGLDHQVAIFLISGKKPEIGEMAKLNKHILDSLSNINEDKYNSVVYTFNVMSTHVIEEKYKSLKKRAIAVTAGTALISAIPVPGIDLAINIGILVAEINHYIKVFGLTRKQLESLHDFDYTKLKCKGILSSTLSFKNMTDIIGQQLGKFAVAVAVVTMQSVLDICIPFVGSIISSATTAGLVHGFLNKYLDDLRHDAIVVYEHITPQ